MYQSKPSDTMNMFSLPHIHAEYVFKMHTSETHTINPKNSKPRKPERIAHSLVCTNNKCVRDSELHDTGGTANWATEGQELPRTAQCATYTTAHSSHGIRQAIKTKFRGKVFQRKYVKMGDDK